MISYLSQENIERREEGQGKKRELKKEKEKES